jgi:hypothetical protein
MVVRAISAVALFVATLGALAAPVQADKSQVITVPEDTQIYVWIDRKGCSPWSELSPKTGHRTFYILPDCKVDVSTGRP